MDVATPGQAPDSFDWNPPAPLPLNLRSHFGKFGIGGDDLIIIEGLPEGAELTAGVCKPDGSWSLRAIDVDNAAFIPLYENGETYTLKICLLAPDPSDHGLPKTKGKLQIPVAVPLAALPVLEAFEGFAANKRIIAAADDVILLPADPALKAVPAAAPEAAAPTPPMPAADRPPATTPPLDFDRHFAALRAEWQTDVKNQVAAAEKRLRTAYLQQLSKIQAVLAQEEAAHTTAISAKWKVEMDRRAADVEAELKARAREHLVALEARLRSKSDAGVVDPAAVERDVDNARAAWEIEEGARRAKDAAELAAAHQRHVAQLEAQYAALHEMRMTAAEAGWRKAEAERLAAAELAWSKREAERLAAAEAKWRSEHDKRLEVVLANLDTMVQGQLGNVDGTQPLPTVEPALKAPPPPRESQPDASDGRADARRHGDAAAIADETRWHKTAAA